MKQQTIMFMVVMGMGSTGFAEKVPVSITKFTNKSTHNPNEQNCYGWGWFSSDPGLALQERAIEKLQDDSRFEVLERETIHQINDDEVNLVNSEKTAPIEKGHFKKAKYTLVGAVKTLEFCNENSGASLNVGRLIGFGDLNVGGKRQTAQVEVTLRLIDTKTGSVIATSTGDATENRSGVTLSGDIKNVDFSGKHFKDSSLGKAMDDAIAMGVTRLMNKVPKL